MNQAVIGLVEKTDYNRTQTVGKYQLILFTGLLLKSLHFEVQFHTRLLKECFQIIDLMHSFSVSSQLGKE